MKAIQLVGVFAAILSLATLNADAKIWRVNNRSNYNGTSLWGDNLGGTAAYPVFKEVLQANGFGVVISGDTIHVEGSSAVYDAVTITKRLVLIGTGYFLTDNPKTSSNSLSSKIAKLTFNSSAANSTVIGLDIVYDGLASDGIVYVYAEGVTIKRCRIEQSVSFATLLQDVYITQNFFSNTYATNCLSTNGLASFVPPTDIVFTNNICQKKLTWGFPLDIPTTFWPIIQCNNNVFAGPDNLATPNLAFSTNEFRNNILLPTNAIVNIAASSGAISYNIGTQAGQFGTANNNLVVPAVASLFITSTSRDAKYQILAGSQASNNGFDGTDRGAFGGTALTNRYTLSGLAPAPVIYEINTSGVANQSGLPVTIKARSIK